MIEFELKVINAIAVTIVIQNVNKGYEVRYFDIPVRKRTDAVA